MAGFIPQDLDNEQTVPLQEFTPEEGVDTVKTSEQKIADLKQLNPEINEEEELKLLKQAETETPEETK